MLIWFFYFFNLNMVAAHILMCRTKFVLHLFNSTAMALKSSCPVIIFIKRKKTYRLHKWFFFFKESTTDKKVMKMSGFEKQLDFLQADWTSAWASLCLSSSTEPVTHLSPALVAGVDKLLSSFVNSSCFNFNLQAQMGMKRDWIFL